MTKETIRTASAAAMQAISDIEQQARAKYRAEVAAEGAKQKASPIEMNTAQTVEAEAVELPAATSFEPRERVKALRGDMTRVTQPNPERGAVHGPSPDSQLRFAKAEAARQLKLLEDRASEREAKAAFDPEKVLKDSRAKERQLKRHARQISELVKRLEALEGDKE